MVTINKQTEPFPLVYFSRLHPEADIENPMNGHSENVLPCSMIVRCVIMQLVVCARKQPICSAVRAHTRERHVRAYMPKWGEVINPDCYKIEELRDSH